MSILKNFDSAHAVSFSGHRPERLPGAGNPTALEMQKLIATLNKTIIDSIDRGKTTFLHGCMAGWDIVCAEQIIILKKQHPRIQLISVAPYKGSFFSREKYSSTM